MHYDLTGAAREAAVEPECVPAARPAVATTVHPRPAHARGDGLVALDDLVHPLMAEVERLCDLAHRAAGGVQAADRMVVVELCPIRLVLELEQSGPELACLGERWLV
jgi:hypothetical protein